MRRRIIGLVITAVALYGVAPAVIDVLGGYKDLDRVSPAWWIAVIVTQVAGWVALWDVQRLALHTKNWFAIATSQLASGSLGRVVPGGAAATAALQYRMLWQAGLSRPAVATGLAAGSILLLGALASLPLLAVPALVAGRKIPHGLLNAGILALVIFVFLFALGALLIVSDRVVRWVGRTTTRLLKRLRQVKIDDRRGAVVVVVIIALQREPKMLDRAVDVALGEIQPAQLRLKGHVIRIDRGGGFESGDRRVVRHRRAGIRFAEPVAQLVAVRIELDRFLEQVDRGVALALQH